MKVSVAICTYNRADSLADTLNHLRGQRGVENLEWELLLIDNNCRDHTSEVAEQFRTHLPLRYLVEKNQGLSHGRNRALKEARGALLVFTDDDVRPQPDWLSAYSRATERYSAAEYFGGPIVPYWPRGKPRWVRDVNMPLLGGLFGIYNLGESERLYREDDIHPFGANFALRRSLFKRLGSFRADLGVKGDTPGRGEEAEYFKRVSQDGASGVYLPDAKTLHRVDPDNLQLRHLYKFGVQKGMASRLIDGTDKRRRIDSEVVYLAKGIYQLMQGRGDRFRQCVINMGICRGMVLTKNQIVLQRERCFSQAGNQRVSEYFRTRKK